ncbi:MAG: rubrerythrin family protein [Rikenellaceae bacterium]
MKNLLLLAVIGLFAFTGCQQQPKPVKTIENLKAAIKGETTASAKYSAFAIKATENHPAIAKLFEAASKAECIHASNHRKALESLDEKMEEFTPEFEVKTTLENLQATVQGETYEIEAMYPRFLADAAAEKVEKTIISIFEKIEQSENDKNPLPTGYVVCPICGNRQYI